MVEHLCLLCSRYSRGRLQAFQVVNRSVQVLHNGDISLNSRYVSMRLDEVPWSTGSRWNDQFSTSSAGRGRVSMFERGRSPFNHVRNIFSPEEFSS